MATQDPADVDITQKTIISAEDSQELAEDDLESITGGIFSNTGVTDTATTCISV